MSRERIRRHYEPRLRTCRENYSILDWASAESQRARFQVLVGNVDLRGRSLLDVGSGLGDLLAFLAERDISVRYTGVDILEKMVQAARRRHPDADFRQADIFESNPFQPKAFDVSFCSGVFNLNLGNNRRFLPVALMRLFELSRRHVVFNLLHVRARMWSASQRYAFFDPADVLEMLKGFPCTVRVTDDYLPNDFTVVCTLAPAGDEPGKGPRGAS